MAIIDNWISVAQASEILGVSPGRVRQWIVSGDLPSVEIGRMRLLERTKVERFARIPRPNGRPPQKKSG